MVAFTRVLCAGIVLALVAGDVRAADEGLSRVQIARFGKRATALVEVRRPGGFRYGSAFCVHPSGLFLTNRHVTADAEGDITLVLDCGLKTERSYRARVVRTDQQHDLALLRAEGARDLPALALGSDEDLEELMEVVAFGFPFGRMLEPIPRKYPAISVNAGSITSLRRRDGKLTVIQFDVAVNPGNSGGPLLDRNGKVVGVVVASVVLRGGARTGVNFGIPVSTAVRFLARPDLRFEPPRLGPANVFQPVRFEAQLVPILPAQRPYTVDLTLKAANANERTQRMEAVGDNRYQVTTVPVPHPSGPLTVRLLAQLEQGLLSASASDQAVRVGGRELKLSEVRTLQLGARPRAVLQDGQSIEGAVSGLEAVPVRQGEQTRTVNLARASEVRIAPVVPVNVLSYTVLVKQSGEEVLRQSDSLLIQSLPRAPTTAGSAGVKPPLLEGDKVVRQLPAEITDVAVGGAGRYLVLRLGALHHLAVFDVSAAAVTGYIPLREADALFTAGLDHVIVLLPHAGTVERWSLKTLEREESAALPIKGVVKALAMGSASKGPLLVHWAVGTKELDRASFAVIDLGTMRTLTDDVGMFPILGSCYRDLVHIRASANGKVFGMWCTSHGPSGVGVLVLSDTGYRSYYAHWEAGHVLPSPDGKVVFTQSGKYAPEVKLTDTQQDGEAMVPACQGNFYLSLPQAANVGSVQVGVPGSAIPPRQVRRTGKAGPPTLHVLGNDRPIATLPDLDLPAPNEQWIKNDFTFDKRIHLIPEARLIITIPAANDRLVLRRFDAAKFEPPVGEVYHLDWQDEQQGFPANLWWTRFTPDGRAFMAGGDGGPRGDVRLWDVATGTLLQRFVPGGEPWFSNGLFLPDGKQLLTWYSKESNLFLWDVATGKLVRKLPGPIADPASVAISPDGHCYLAGGNDRVIHIYDLQTGKELAKLQGHEGPCRGTFSPDGKKVLTYSSDKTLRLWDAASGKFLHKLEGHSAACTGVFSPDGKRVLSYSPDKTVRLWDVASGKAVRLFEGPTDEVTFASFLPDGEKVVAWGKDRTVRVWEVLGGKVLHQYDLGGKLGEAPNAALSPDGRRLLLSNYNKTVQILELATGKFSELQHYEKATNASGFSFSADGRYAAAGSFRAGVYLWRLPR